MIVFHLNESAGYGGRAAIKDDIDVLCLVHSSSLIFHLPDVQCRYLTTGSRTPAGIDWGTWDNKAAAEERYRVIRHETEVR